MPDPAGAPNLADYRRDRPLSIQERDSRWGRVREAMRRAELPLLLTAPNPGFWDQLQAHATFLSSIGGNCAPVSVVFPLEGDVTAVVGPVPSAEFWTAWQSWITDVRATPWTVGAGVAARLKELAIDGKPIGIVGLSGTPRFPEGLVTTGFLDFVRKACPNSQLIDATEMLNELRSTKSPEEVAAVQDAVGMTESAFDLMTREARPGVAERVVYGKMVGHMIELGSIPPNFLMWSVGNPFRHSLAPFPTARPLRTGEVIHVEIEARNSSGYLGQITRTAFLGRAPDQLREMFAICKDTIEDVMGRLRAGRQMRDVLDAYKSRTKDNRYTVLPVIHARALGEDRPMVIFNTEDSAVLGYGLEKNQTFAVKAQVRDDRTGLLAFWGESICVGDSGAIRSGKHPIELAEIS